LHQFRIGIEGSLAETFDAGENFVGGFDVVDGARSRQRSAIG
jgi:hypothetical protein